MEVYSFTASGVVAGVREAFGEVSLWAGRLEVCGGGCC